MSDDKEVNQRVLYQELLKFSWFAAVSAVALMGISIYVMGAQAAPILTMGVPAIVALGGVRDFLEKRNGDNEK